MESTIFGYYLKILRQLIKGKFFLLLYLHYNIYLFIQNSVEIYLLEFFKLTNIFIQRKLEHKSFTKLLM